MQKIYFTLFLLSFVMPGFAQVGIGTSSPTPGFELDVNGSLLVQDDFKLKSLTSGTSEDGKFEFLTRIGNSLPPGELARLDLEELTVAPINIFNYSFINLSKDNVTEVNLQFDASKYVVGLSNFSYKGQQIEKGKSGNDYVDIGNFVARTFVKQGTDVEEWHLEIRNRTRDAASDNTITYNVTLLVYDKRYFKQLETIPADLKGTNSGSAPAPVGL